MAITNGDVELNEISDDGSLALGDYGNLKPGDTRYSAVVSDDHFSSNAIGIKAFYFMIKSVSGTLNSIFGPKLQKFAVPISWRLYDVN